MVVYNGSCSAFSGSDLVIRFVSETGSTNEDMKQLAAEGAAEGVWLRAGRQSAGKGRMGRAWEGEDGNVYASTLVRMQAGDPSPPTLAFVTAVAVHSALSEFVGAGLLRIKWPNDIMACLPADYGAGRSGGDYAKLCGMLMERTGDAIIIGIGVNVVAAPHLPDRRATCLRDLGATGCDAAAVLSAMAEHFRSVLAQWRTYGTEPVIRAWLAQAHPAGTPLGVSLPDGTQVEGLFETLDKDGALILRLADGSSHAIHAGDVFLL